MDGRGQADGRERPDHVRDLLTRDVACRADRDDRVQGRAVDCHGRGDAAHGMADLVGGVGGAAGAGSLRHAEYM